VLNSSRPSAAAGSSNSRNTAPKQILPPEIKPKVLFINPVENAVNPHARMAEYAMKEIDDGRYLLVAYSTQSNLTGILPVITPTTQ
jgi:hypothetical protein